MAATMLDGNKIAAEIKSEVATEVAMLAKSGVRPGLAVILVGNNPASEIYVRNKVKACESLGIYSEKLTPPDSVTTAQLLAMVSELNARDEIDCILVQLPLPAQVDAKAVLRSVAPEKDVDGFHPVNVGNLSTGQPGLRPCTPSGCIELLRRSNIPIAGQNAVVVGRSDIVGKPAAMMLLNHNATVTICHSKTRDLPGVCRTADLLVVAIGKPAFVTSEFVKPGAVVIDVGMNKITDPAELDRCFPANDPAANDPANANNDKRRADFAAKGSTLVGDVHPQVQQVAGFLTPVPGGVGPLTIAMLMSNTVKAARLRRASGLASTPARQAGEAVLR